MIERDKTRYPIDAEAVGRAAYNISVAFNEIWASITDTFDRIAADITTALSEETLAMIWAVYNAPHLYYLSEHARTRRARKKNKKRIIALYRSR